MTSRTKTRLVHGALPLLQGGVCCAGVAAVLAPVFVLICPYAYARECLKKDENSSYAKEGEEGRRQSGSSGTGCTVARPTSEQPESRPPMTDRLAVS
jgi:hypothetical protein